MFQTTLIVVIIDILIFRNRLEPAGCFFRKGTTPERTKRCGCSYLLAQKSTISTAKSTHSLSCTLTLSHPLPCTLTARSIHTLSLTLTHTLTHRLPCTLTDRSTHTLTHSHSHTLSHPLSCTLTDRSIHTLSITLTHTLSHTLSPAHSPTGLSTSLSSSSKGTLQ